MSDAPNPFESPTSTDYVSSEGQSHSGWMWILFSYQGRIPRRLYWGATLLITFLFYAIVLSAAGIFGDESPVAIGVTLAAYVPMLWSSLAVAVKRWHDRDKSGWWVLIGIVPCIGAIWAFIENGLLRGTEGPNRYGPDPT